MNQSTRYQVHLHRGGLGLEEMRRLLLAWAEHGDWESLRQRTFRENLLGKRSDAIIKDLLAAFKRRFLTQSGLPSPVVVARMLRASIPEASKNQTLLPYYLCTDALAEQCYRELVLPRYDSSSATLTTQEVKTFLDSIVAKHPDTVCWSPYLRVRWARGFCTLLRAFNLMEPYPSTRLKRLYLLPEPFAFFWLWFWEQDGSFWIISRRDLWTLLQLNDSSLDELLVEGQIRGWWIYQRSGDIVAFQPNYQGLSEWLEALMS